MARKAALIFGIIFVLIGVLGFFSNPIVGESQGALFHTDLVHNLVHIISGAILIWAGRKSPAGASKALIVFGLVYLLVAIIGFVQIGSGEEGEILGLIGANSADNILHVILAALFLVVGFAGRPKADAMVSGMAQDSQADMMPPSDSNMPPMA